MASRKVGLVPTLFTTLVAPVLVSLALRHLSGADSHDVQAGPELSPKDEGPHRQHSAVRSSSPAPIVAKAETAAVVGRGTGRSPDEALQEALRSALRSALVARVDPNLWSREETTILKGILHNTSGLIVHWEDRGCTSRWRLSGRLYSREVATIVDCRALEERARMICSPR